MRAGPILSAIRRREVIDRALTYFESKLDGGHEGSTYMLEPEAEIFRNLGISFERLREPPLGEIERHVIEKQANAPLPASGVRHDANLALAKLCYAYCRQNPPALVVETGVGNGVTTCFILTALAVNVSGRLISVDLPPLGLTSGSFVPEELKNRWELRLGRSRRLLPDLLRKNPPVDLFLHDSLHTYRNMLFEYEAAWKALRPGGLLLSDDIAFNQAFLHFTSRMNTLYAAVHKDALFGVAKKSPS